MGSWKNISVNQLIHSSTINVVIFENTNQKYKILKEILVQYATYNLWANQRLINTINNLPEDVADAAIINSFSSIKKTLQHLNVVEFIWWQRLKLVESILPLEEKNQSAKEIGKELLSYSLQWKEWVEKSTVAAFEHEFVYRNSKKEQFKQPVYQMLIHLFNHQTYHRGQLVTMLRQVGIEKIPATDFIEWSRKK